MSQEQDAAVSLYRKDPKVYPRDVKGSFASLRKLAVIVLLGLYYILPWLNWGGHQSVLFDLPARKFYILGLTFWPQDFIFLTLMLIIAGLSLFFVTAVAGRLWCGYACPQTVWTEVFLWMERLVEGDRGKRIKLDASPWNTNKILRKTSKQVLWIGFALWTGFTFVGFFTPIRELGYSVVTFQLGSWETFWLLFYSFATYGNAGILREQVCKYMCPYARFQSAMFDKDSLIITYDVERGEPRGARRRSADPKTEGLGDCIDCKICVQVCPTGIDIRQGLQYECIACAMCVDACDSVMDKMEYPRGLIKYTTENAILNKGYHMLRPRTIVYTAILATLITAMVMSIVLRPPVILDAMRDRNALYKDVGRRGIENSYTLKIINKQNVDREYRLSVQGLDGIELVSEAEFSVAAESVYTLPTSVTVPHEMAAGGNTIEFVLQDVNDSSIRIVEESRFRGPSADY
jgi:cytochrome c oxidase accessory protein FixG